MIKHSISNIDRLKNTFVENYSILLERYFNGKFMELENETGFFY